MSFLKSVALWTCCLAVALLLVVKIATVFSDTATRVTPYLVGVVAIALSLLFALHLGVGIAADFRAAIGWKQKYALTTVRGLMLAVFCSSLLAFGCVVLAHPQRLHW